MEILVTGSIAYDYLMRFPGSFQQHFIPDQLHDYEPQFPGRRYDQALGRRRRQYRIHAWRSLACVPS